MIEQLTENDSKASAMLSDRAIELLDLPYVIFKYGDIDFFRKDEIDAMQDGYRNDDSGDINDEWIGAEYVVIGLDSATSADVDLFIVKTDENNYPIYWLNKNGGEWRHPSLICNSLEHFNTIIKMLKNYQNYLDDGALTLEMRDEVINKMANIMGTNDVSNYWFRLLNNSVPGVVA